jgi:pimeloyl-ACP methyl ester carboxylesterase
MASTTANGITIEYETAGDPVNPALLLIMGLGGQLIAWDDEFVAELVARDFYVVRFDNRDVGLSTWFDEAGIPDLAAAFTTGVNPAYLLSDMAADAAGLLDALRLESAAVLGISMGGMIAQTLAIEHPQKVRALTSIMSNTGAPSVGQPTETALSALMVPPPPDREAAIELAVKTWQVVGSPGFPFHEERIRAEAGAAYDRALHPAGIARQAVAILASPDRTPGLRSLDLPALVIHGESDQLVQPSGGQATAAAIPGAALWLVPGMGHDLPRELFGQIAHRVAALREREGRSSRPDG